MSFVTMLVASAFAEEPAPSGAAAPVVETPPIPGVPLPTSVPVPPIVAPDPDVAALLARVSALEKQVTDQQQAIAQQRLAAIPKKDLEFDLDGYYRVRTFTFNHLFASQTDDDGEYRDARLMTQRLRLQPKISYRQLAKFYLQVDALDDVAWGDNESLASTALFAGDPTNTNVDGQPEPTIQLSRAWAEITIPVGSIRAGRMASHWGMGLLANDGNGFDDTFGENHFNTTFDRVMFATRPIAVARALMGKPDNNIPLFAAIAVDRLVEDPLVQFYGYECEPGIRQDTQPDQYKAECDANGDGLTDREHGYTDDERVPTDRNAEWWVDQDDDVMEIIYVLVYRGEDVKYLGATGDLTAGVYVINRVQRETDSDVWIADAYVNAKNRGVHFEFEGLTIKGTTRAIALPGSINDDGDPLYKTANIYSYVGRLGYERPDWAVTMEHGYASGDDNVADANFTGRPIAPDHNVGLLMYEQILARVTADRWSEGASALWSQGGVYDSRYIFPNVHYYPLDNYEIEAAFLTAWPDKADGAIVLCREGTDECDGAGTATAKSFGWEVDAAFKMKWHEHALFALEAGYANMTDRLPLEASGLDPGGKYFTVQSRLAYQF